jgi:hypothetical protein
VIATVRPGTHELIVRDEADLYYSARPFGGGQTLATSLGSRTGGRVVTLQRVCRV